MAPPNKKRRALLAATIGLGLGLLATETVVRLWVDPLGDALEASKQKLPRWSHLLQNGLFQYESDPNLHYSLAPGFDFEYEGIRYRTNSLGMRGGEVVMPKPAGTRRILMLGDSYTYGLGAPEAGTLEVCLEEALNAMPSSLRTEVLNLGIPAFHTGQERAWLERLGFELDADLVVLVYFANDATEPAYHYNPRLKVLATDETALPYGMKNMLWRTAIYASIASKSAATYANSGAMSPGTGQTWPLVEQRLEDFATSCAVEGLPLVIVNLPSVQLAEVTADEASYAPHLADAKRVADFAAAAGIPCIELAPLLQDLAKSGDLDGLLVDPTPGLFYDDHFTPEGNAILAGVIAGALSKLPLTGP